MQLVDLVLVQKVLATIRILAYGLPTGNQQLGRRWTISTELSLLVLVSVIYVLPLPLISPDCSKLILQQGSLVCEVV
jgi:hypothetical protein